jgi:AraC-like DNA-binding protein
MRYQPIDNEEVIAKVRDLVEKRKMFRNNRLSLTQIAGEVGISRSTLSSIINREMNMSFIDYINGLRLKFALETLQDNSEELSVEQISLLAGFSCPSTFYRQHKKVYGNTPLENIKYNK